MTPGPWLLGAAAGLAAGVGFGPRAPRGWLAVTLGATAAALVACLLVLVGGAPWEWRSTFSFCGQPLHLRLDDVSAVFAVLLSLVGGAGAAYAHGYWRDREHPDSAPRGRRWWSAFLFALGLVLLSANGVHFLLGWELFAVSAFFLVTLDRRRREVRAAGWLYLASSHAATLCLFGLFTALAAHQGSWELGPMRDQPALAPLFWLALVGFGLKAGMFPLHIWLPSAHANAPSHVSAMLSGVALKVGLYGLVRFSTWLPLPTGAGWTVLGFGAVSALLGIAFALAQDDVKRLLAYSSVENMGIILVGLGGALLAATHGDAPWGRLALAGALLHVWNHGLFKALLFFAAGSVLHATGTRDMSRLGGLWRAMPWTAALFTLGTLAVCGLPPLNGFVSEWLVYLGLFDAVAGRDAAAWAALPAAIMLGVTGALALATFTKAAGTIFLGAARTKPARVAHESGWWLRAPMLVLATGCITIGLAPLAFWPAIARAAGAWHAAWAGAEPPAPLRMLSAGHLALALVAAAAVAGLWRRTHRQGLRAGPTWDCGYAAPAPRMQYTSGSFAGIAAGWFGWILRPERQAQRLRGFFPVEANLRQRIPETVLERVLTPASRGILQLAQLARRLQHGRLQYYVAYVAIGLAGLGTLVAFAAP